MWVTVRLEKTVSSKTEALTTVVELMSIGAAYTGEFLWGSDPVSVYLMIPVGEVELIERVC